MSKITAQIVADSKNKFGNRLTTFVVTFPRIILAEFNTHRMLSKNSASSRAIPFNKMLKMVETNPFIPIAFQKDHKGMQGTQYFSGWREKIVRLAWVAASKAAIFAAKKLNKLGVTKQLCNRLLEPFMYHTVIVSGTEWENFFHLRSPQYGLFYEQIPMTFRSKKDLLKFVKQVEATEFKNQYDNLTDLEWLKINKGMAEIHIMALAEAMWDAYQESIPKELKDGEWHIPYESEIEKLLPPTLPIREGLTLDEGVNEYKIKLSTVMAARTSYTVVGEDQKPLTWQRMVELHDEMAAANPKHMSPFEHCGRAMDDHHYAFKSSYNDSDETFGWSGNFRGFIQYRKTFAGENAITKTDNSLQYF